MKIHSLYHAPIPDFLLRLAEAPEMRRLKHVGMNCGCEYTAFPRFSGLRPYSRFDHSLGTACIVWHFTADPAQSAAALFHDIASPAFAHVVDFLYGDHLRQESTERGTEEIIRASEGIRQTLSELGVELDDVVDYHRYPIADNDAPRLSADRLEYTLGNLENYGLRDPGTLCAYYWDLSAADNEEGQPELCFRDEALALAFAHDALRCSKIYVSDEDRYAMQMLAELLRRALERGVLTEYDLLQTETHVIARLCADSVCAAEWECYRGLHEMLREEASAPVSLRRVIPAKKRCIDPFVAGKGRVSALNIGFARELAAFLSEPQDRWLCAR